MKKTAITICAAAVLLAGMAAAILLLNAGSEEDGSQVTQNKDTIFVMKPRAQTEIQEIKVQNANGGFTLHTSSTTTTTEPAFTFQLKEAEALPLYQDRLDSVLLVLSNFTASMLVAEGEEELAQFGMQSPAATIQVTYSDGVEKLTLGDAAPDGESRYAADARGNVYLIENAKAELFLESYLALLDRSITPGDTQSAFTAVTLGGSVREEPIVIERSPGTGETAPVSAGDYRIVSPQSHRLNPSGFAGLTGLFGLSGEAVAAVVGSDGDLAEYGLDEPYSTAEVESGAESFLLLQSEPDAQGMVFLYTPDSPLVYVSHEAGLPWLAFQTDDLRDPVAVIPEIDRVETLLVETANLSYTVSLSGQGEDLAVTVNGEAVDTAAFRTVYASIISASLEEAAGEPPAEGAGLILRFTYTYRDGAEQDVVEMLSGPPRKVYIRLNGGPWYLTQSLYADGILEDLRQW